MLIAACVVPLDEQLKRVMVGQLMPIYSVSSALRRRDAGWHDSQKPMVFLFLGSSGVGKTMLAKQLAGIMNKVSTERTTRGEARRGEDRRKGTGRADNRGNMACCLEQIHKIRCVT